MAAARRGGAGKEEGLGRSSAAEAAEAKLAAAAPPTPPPGRSYAGIIRDTGVPEYETWYNTAYIANIQLGLTSLVNNWAYVGKLRIEANGFAWEWVFAPPPTSP